MDSTFSVLGLTAHAYGLCASAAALVLLGGMAILARRRRMPAGLTPVFGLLGIHASGSFSSFAISVIGACICIWIGQKISE